MSSWPDLIKALQEKQGVSGRRLSTLASVNRGTLMRFMLGNGDLGAGSLARIFDVLGYDLRAIERLHTHGN